MKKRRKLFFIFSLAAQLISYCAAVFMLVKKRKSAAGTFAAAGLLGTLAGIAILNLKDEPDKSGRKICRSSAESKNKKHSGAGNTNSVSSPSDKVCDCETPDSCTGTNMQNHNGGNINEPIYGQTESCINANPGNLSDEQLSRANELENISKAIDILRHSSAADDSHDFDDIEAELEAKLSE